MATKSPTVVYVHGGGPQPADDDAFRRRLNGCLKLSDAVPSRLACYDHIRPTTPAEAAAIEAASAPSLAPVDAASMLVDVIEPPPGYDLPGNARDIAREYLASKFRCLQSQALDENLEATEVRELARSLSEAELDTIAYLFFRWGDPMRAPVEQTLAGVTGPVVIVAHSLGSIIVFDILSGRRTDDVWLFLAAGSPMGNPVIRARRVGRLFCFSRVPKSVKAWVNVFDEKDVVACVHPKIADVFHPRARVRDVPVTNPASNHHDLEGYLGLQGVHDEVKRGLVQPVG